MLCLIVEYFPKIPGGLFCFQSCPVLWEQGEPNTEFLSFETLLCIFFPIDCLFPHPVLNMAFMFRLQSGPLMLLSKVISYRDFREQDQTRTTGLKDKLCRICLKPLD